jgi:methionyl-tRNA synthetase
VDPPDALVCNDFYELSTAKFSTGRAHAIWGRELARGGLSADPLRLHLAATRPEGRRTSFTMPHYRRTLDELESGWVTWLEGVAQRLRSRFEGTVPEAGAWDAEHLHFFADIQRLHHDIALAYEPASLSLRRAGTLLRAFVERAREFAASQQPDGHPEIGARRTGLALELMGLRCLALGARPLLPAIAGAVLEQLGASDAYLGGEPEFVTPGSTVTLAPAVAAWREAIAEARGMADSARTRTA